MAVQADKFQPKETTDSQNWLEDGEPAQKLAESKSVPENEESGMEHWSGHHHRYKEFQLFLSPRRMYAII